MRRTSRTAARFASFALSVVRLKMSNWNCALRHVQANSGFTAVRSYSAIWSETYATADIVAYDDQPMVKAGREFLLRRR